MRSDETAASTASDAAETPRVPAVPLFLRAAGRALAAPIAWLAFAIGPLLLALGPAFAWGNWFSRATAHRATDAQLIAQLDETFRFDHRAALGELSASVGAFGAVLAFLAALLGCFCAGGTLELFTSAAGESPLRRFCSGGASLFLRFARIALLQIAVLALAGWVLYGLPWQKLVLELCCGLPGGDPQEFASEASAVHAVWVQDGLYALVFACTSLWAAHTRARVALRETRSACIAGLRTCWLLLRHPLRIGLPAASIALLQVLAVAAIGAFANARNHHFELDGAGWQIGVLLVCTIAAILVTALARVAQYALAVELVRELVPPLAPQSAWPNAAGGPGGPQYPIGGDEFGVSV
jgi:hypothetical protein